KRRAHHILNRLETVGAEIDAYTTKEYTCIYTIFMSEHLERALELMSDIIFQSQFPEREVNKEKNVVIDEIQSYLDSPSEQISDDFEQLVFESHPLGKGILGTVESVQSFSSAKVSAFHHRHYTPSNMVLSTSVNLPSKKTRNLVKKHFGGLKQGSAMKRLNQTHSINPLRKTTSRNTFQSHYITGTTAYNIKSEKRFTMNLLNNLLGGQAMNSRLNMNIREKYGYTYHIESGYSAFSDNGLFYIYLGSDKKNIGRIEKLLKKELNKLKDNELSPSQMRKVIQQYQGQVSIAAESRVNQVVQRARSLMTLGRIERYEEVIQAVSNVTSSDIIETANELFNLNKFSCLIFEND
ncbi:MAG TPA: peptidase M16, partial [Flavobacteriales bacterium]|nr:peptidase M16 [Flavobacteriales bacterium]